MIDGLGLDYKRNASLGSRIIFPIKSSFVHSEAPPGPVVGGEFSVLSIGAGVCLAQLRLEAGIAGSALGSAECFKAFWNRSRGPELSLSSDTPHWDLLI